MDVGPGDEVDLRLDQVFAVRDGLDLYQACGWYPKSSVEDLRSLQGHAYVIVTAWLAEKMVGTLTVLSDGRNYATLDDLVVHPNHRGRGIGANLVRMALSTLSGVDPDVTRLVAVPGVEPFYERLGFRRTAETVMYLSDPNLPRSR